jgi:hypothetical protein
VSINKLPTTVNGDRGQKLIFIITKRGNEVMLAKQLPLLKEGLLTLLILVLVAGALGLAIIDANSRPAFIDLAKVGMAGYLGWMMPRSSIGS